MKMKTFLFGLVALLALGLMAACGDDDNGSPTPAPTLVSSFPVIVGGSDGQSLTLQSAPQRIVALAPSFVEVLYAIGAGSSLVAADDNTDYPPEAASLTKISGFTPSVEGIAAQNPDLVIIVYDPGGLKDALATLNIPVLLLDFPTSLNGVYEQMATLGRVSGHVQEASDTVTRMKGDVRSVTAPLAGVTAGPRVYHENDNTYYTSGPGSFIDDLYKTLKAQNIAEGTGQPFPQLTAEAIIQANPEVIILADEDAGESSQTVKARAGWSDISAVKSSRVHTIDPDIISRPGPRLSQALLQLAHFLYPDKFP